MTILERGDKGENRMADIPYRDTMVVGRLGITNQYATDGDLPDLEAGPESGNWLGKIVLVEDWDSTGDSVLAWAHPVDVAWVPLSLSGGA